MFPIKQTNTAKGSGNCLAACLASILEIPIESIPDFWEGNFYQNLDDFLAGKGMVPIWIRFRNPKDGFGYIGYTPKFCIAIGQSPRYNDVNHAVVARPNGFNYEVIFDPHPDNKGIVGPIKSILYLGVKL